MYLLFLGQKAGLKCHLIYSSAAQYITSMHKGLGPSSDTGGGELSSGTNAYEDALRDVHQKTNKHNG